MSADELSSATLIAERFLDNIETVVHGKREQIKLVVAALMCGGHALLEDVPGTAKTVLARAIAGSIKGSQVSRIQCTPDLQPTDVTGLSIFDQKVRDFAGCGQRLTDGGSSGGASLIHSNGPRGTV